MIIRITEPKRDTTVKKEWYYIGIHVDDDNGKYLTNKTLFGGSPGIVDRKAEKWIKNNKDFLRKVENDRLYKSLEQKNGDEDHLPF